MSDDNSPKRLKPTTAERPRGILSKADRQFLAGESDLQDQSQRKRRKVIRQRVFHGILDFWLLVDYLSDKDVEQIFDQTKELFDEDLQFPPPFEFLHDHYRVGPTSPDRVATTAFQESLIDVVALAYQGADELNAIQPDEIIEAGMSKYLLDYGRTASVDSMEATVGEMEEKLRTGKLNPYEFKYLLGKGIDDPDSLHTESSQLPHKSHEWMIERRGDDGA